VNSELAGGLLAAIGGAICYGAAPAIQAVAAGQEKTGGGAGIRLTLRLAGRPVWLLGFAGELGGFALEAFAFSRAPTTLVAPVMTLDLVVFVLLAGALVGERPARRGRYGIAAMIAGIALLALSFVGRSGLGEPADAAQLWFFLALCVACSGVAALAGNRALAARRPTMAAGAFSLVSGVAYGLATLTTRQVGRTFHLDAPWQLLTTPTPYVLVGCSILAITMMQRGLQTGPLLTYPITSVTSSVVPVLIGAALLDDPVPGGMARAGFVVALVLVVAGVVLLAQDRARAG
jgi:drug/metabolite transporter (DMT)-like permease